MNSIHCGVHTRRQADGTVEGTHEGSTVPDTGYTFIRKNVYTTLL